MSKETQKTELSEDKALHIGGVMPSFDSPKNWTEDYKHENGNYICNCYKCKEYFYGHKRRPLCKECGS